MEVEIQIVRLSKQELEELIQKAVRVAIEEFSKSIYYKAEMLPEMLTTKDVAKFLNISVRTVQTYAANGMLPKVYIGNNNKIVRFKKESVLEFTKAYNNKAAVKNLKKTHF